MRAAQGKGSGHTTNMHADAGDLREGSLEQLILIGPLPGEAPGQVGAAAVIRR